VKNELSQRLPLDALKAYEALGYGMFIHYGMNTFLDDDHAPGDAPASLFAPTRVDCAQWARTAKAAGMKYAVLTAKHVSGFCLWPSEHTDYHVGNSPWGRDVVRDFVDACRAEGILPGLYYCCWDNHHRMGSIMPDNVKDDGTFDYDQIFASEAYMDFCWKQMDELVTRYGDLVELWIDIPVMLPPHFRQKLYDHLAERQPQMLVVTNNGMPPQPGLRPGYCWPTDVYVIEKTLPPQPRYQPEQRVYQKSHYLPMESCEPMGRHWFGILGDEPKSDQELLGTYLLTRARGANLLFNIGPLASGEISPAFVDALMRLRNKIDKLDAEETTG
jgi:alpha-L-fucosidase